MKYLKRKNSQYVETYCAGNKQEFKLKIKDGVQLKYPICSCVDLCIWNQEAGTVGKFQPSRSRNSTQSTVAQSFALFISKVYYLNFGGAASHGCTASHFGGSRRDGGILSLSFSALPSLLFGCQFLIRKQENLVKGKLTLLSKNAERHWRPNMTYSLSLNECTHFVYS